MKYVFFCSFFVFLEVSSAILNPYKIYPIIQEICVFRGHAYTGSNTIDLSHMDLDSLADITDILVEFNKKITWLVDVPRVRILANNNNLKTLPREILNIDLVCLDVTHNDELIVPDWFVHNGRFYFYRSNTVSL